MIDGLIDNWLLPVAAGVIALLAIWGRGAVRPRVASPAIAALATQYESLLSDDVSTKARIDATKRLRSLRPDLDLKTAKDVIDLVVSRRTIL